MNKVAIGRVVLTNREHIIALEPLDKGLMGTLLRYPYEVRSAEEYFDEIQDVKVTKDIRYPFFVETPKSMLSERTARARRGIDRRLTRAPWSFRRRVSNGSL
jgi:hypothetical protein